MQEYFMSMILLHPQSLGTKAQNHFYFWLQVNYTGTSNDINKALYDWTSTCLIQQNCDINGTARWIKRSLQCPCQCQIQQNSLLGIHAWVLCSAGMSPNWLVLPNRPCTSSDWYVSMQTLPASRSQMSHTRSKAARKRTNRNRNKTK